MIKLIFAESLDHVIGVDQHLPWNKQKDDMRNFVKETKGQYVIMGRKTYESIGSKPLKDRLNIVITSKKKEELQNSENLVVFDSIVEAIHLAKDKSQGFFNIIIIGGSQLYQSVLNLDLVDEIIQTVILVEVKNHLSDKHEITFAPTIDFSKFEKTQSIANNFTNDDNEHPWAINYYKRKTKENAQ